LDELEAIEKKALEQAMSATDLKDRAQALEIAKVASEKRKIMEETRKTRFDADELSREKKFARTKHWAATVTPLLAVFLTGAALVVQSWQFKASAALQTQANEESQWRDAIKNVSFKDPGATMVSAFGMHSFFDSPRYSIQARIVAATLLPHVDNSDGFDNIYFDLTDTADESNQAHIIAISKTLFNSQMDLYRVNVLTNRPTLLEFQTLKEMLGDDDPPGFIQGDATSRRQAIANAWMLDSASDGLNDIWSVKKSAAPRATDLGGVILENGDFGGLDFSDAVLQGGAFYNADFSGAKFTGAVFRRRLVSYAILDGTDLSGVLDFAESKWERSNWWNAKCISQELLDYLEKNDATASPENKQAGKAISCH
jgi:Pentapeptide repeats (8 copies)